MRWVRWTQFTSSQPISLRSVLILFPYLSLGFQNYNFPSGFLPQNQFSCSFSPMCVICPTQFILLDWWPELYLMKSMRSTLLIVLFLQSPVTFCHVCPNNNADTYFSCTLSLCSFLNVRYQVSHLYKTSVKTTLLFLINIMFLVGKQEEKIFWSER